MIRDVLCLVVLWLAGCTSVVPPEQAADLIFFGGPIVTVDDKQPSVEAVAVKDGKIFALGAKAALEKAHRGASTRLVDLAGKSLLPGFIDGHAHFSGFGPQAVVANLLNPPDGDVQSIDDLVAKLKEFAKSPDVRRTGWIVGLGYDDALLGRHPNRDDLDQVSTEIPVIAVHISGHMSAINSAGLKKAGYTASPQDPPGGIIRRRPGSREPLGVNEELASMPYTFEAITPKSRDDKDYFLKRGLELAKSFGYTTVNDGRTLATQHQDFLNQAKRGLFDIDVISYIDSTDRKVITPEWFSRS